MQTAFAMRIRESENPESENPRILNPDGYSVLLMYMLIIIHKSQRIFFFIIDE